MIRAAMVAAVALTACGGTTYKEPAPEFDDLDVDLGGPETIVGPPRIIDAERLAAVLEGLPYEARYTMIVRGRIRATARSVSREAVAGEPGGYVALGTIVARVNNQTARSELGSYYAAEPPHRLLVGFEVERVNGNVVRRWDFRNGNDGLWLRFTEDGYTHPPVKLPATRQTLEGSAAIFVEPDLLQIGAMQTFYSFDPQKQRDVLERVTVRAKGTAIVSGRELPTAVFETEYGGMTSVTTVAGGRHLLSMKSRDFTLVKEREQHRP